MLLPAAGSVAITRPFGRFRIHQLCGVEKSLIFNLLYAEASVRFTKLGIGAVVLLLCSAYAYAAPATAKWRAGTRVVPANHQRDGDGECQWRGPVKIGTCERSLAVRHRGDRARRVSPKECQIFAGPLVPAVLRKSE